MELDTSFPQELLARTQYGPDNSGFTSFMQGRESALKERQLRIQEFEAGLQQKLQAIDVQKGMADLKTKIDLQQGQAELSQAMADIDYSNPHDRKRIWEVGARHPALVPTIDNIEQRLFLAHDVAAQKAKYWEDQATFRGQQLELAKQKAEAGPAAVQTAEKVSGLRKRAEQARISGNTEEYQSLNNEADLLQQTMQKSGLQIQFGPGNEILSVTTGVPTVATQSQVQSKNIAYQNAVQGINDVLGKLRPSDVGVQGVLGEQVFDKWLSQVNPALASGERIQNRTALRNLREILFSSLSPERIGGSGFSNKDAERIKELASGLEASTSYPDLQNRLSEIKSVINDRVRVNAQALGQPVPDFVKSPLEITNEYESFKAKMKQDWKENRRTQEQADELIKKAYERAQEALKSAQP